MHDYTLAVPPIFNEIQLSLPRHVELDRLQLLAAAYLPGVDVWEGQAMAAKHKLTIAFTESDQRGFQETPVKLTVSGPYDRDANLVELLHLAYSACRPWWLKQQLYTVHSACFAGASGYVLVVGHSGVGKTSIVVDLARRGKKIFSANKTLLSLGRWCQADCLTAMYGTRAITLGLRDGEELSAGAIAYLGRQAYKLSDNGYAPKGPQQVKAIVLAKLNDGVQELATLSPASALHKLYPYFLDTIAADCIVGGGAGVYSPALPDGCRQKLAASLAAILQAVPVMTMAGTLDFVTTNLERL